MILPPLVPGSLCRRYKRFLADVVLDDGQEVTAHCPNTGAMTGCAEPGSPVWLSISDNPKRKYAHTLEFVETAQGLVSVNTGRANALVGEALREGRLPDITNGDTLVQAEAAIPEGDGRFDFALPEESPVVYIEVKSVTLHREDGLGVFPDAVSTRAQKHVEALARRVAAGERGVLLFCAQHVGIKTVSLAADIDPSYATAVSAAMASGVEVLAVGCATDLRSMRVDAVLPFEPEV